MTGPSDQQLRTARRSRTIAVAIVGTMLAWFAVQFLGARLGLPPRWLGLIDLVALAVMGWAIVAAVMLWRARRDGD